MNTPLERMTVFAIWVAMTGVIVGCIIEASYLFGISAVGMLLAAFIWIGLGE